MRGFQSQKMYVCEDKNKYKFHSCPHIFSNFLFYQIAILHWFQKNKKLPYYIFKLLFYWTYFFYTYACIIAKKNDIYRQFNFQSQKYFF